MEDLMNQLLKQFDNNYKNKREKVWVLKNMLEKNILSMKRFLINKKEENNKQKNNIKDLIALNLKINKKLEIFFENLRLKKIKKKQFQMPYKERQDK
jgi:hypothetical protein